VWQSALIQGCAAHPLLMQHMLEALVGNHADPWDERLCRVCVAGVLQLVVHVLPIHPG
jgi:hypothetical protein